jgi:hypothetical protein
VVAAFLGTQKKLARRRKKHEDFWMVCIYPIQKIATRALEFPALFELIFEPPCLVDTVIGFFITD